MSDYFGQIVISCCSSTLEPALTAVWSKAPPLTARCLSPLPGFRIPAWACEKVASDFELGGGFRRGTPVSPPLLTTLPSHELATIGINVTKNEIPNPKPMGTIMISIPNFLRQQISSGPSSHLLIFSDT